MRGEYRVISLHVDAVRPRGLRPPRHEGRTGDFPDRPVCRPATRLVTIDRDNGIGATLGRLSPCRIASPVVSLSARARTWPLI